MEPPDIKLLFGGGGGVKRYFHRLSPRKIYKGSSGNFLIMDLVSISGAFIKVTFLKQRNVHGHKKNILSQLAQVTTRQKTMYLDFVSTGKGMKVTPESSRFLY